MARMQVTDEAYQKHQVFSELDRYASFYDSLAMAVFGFMTMGTKSICNIDTYVYGSIKGTIESIKAVLLAGRLNDGYALLRKYYDSVVINIYSNLYLNDHFSIDNLLTRLDNVGPDSFVVAKINDWLQGRERLPGYRSMTKYIRNSARLKPVNDAFLGDNKYIALRDRCDDHLHYNFFHHVMLNDNEVSIESRGKWLERLRRDIRDLFILHVGYILFMNSHYMMSSDYVDALECGMTPEEDSQLWVAPFIQAIFDEVITPARPDITALIKSHTSMQLQ